MCCWHCVSQSSALWEPGFTPVIPPATRPRPRRSFQRPIKGIWGPLRDSFWCVGVSNHKHTHVHGEAGRGGCENTAGGAESCQAEGRGGRDGLVHEHLESLFYDTWMFGKTCRYVSLVSIVLQVLMSFGLMIGERIVGCLSVWLVTSMILVLASVRYCFIFFLQNLQQCLTLQKWILSEMNYLKNKTIDAYFLVVR